MAHSALAPVIIIKKKKKHGHAHHGGAWKVAYADFVTAMMALFIVLWLMNSTPQVKESVSGYFNDPQGFKAGSGTGQAGSGTTLQLAKTDLNQLKEKLEEAFKMLPNLNQALKDKVKMNVTGEGLRIEFLEVEDGMFFQSGSSVPTGGGSQLLSVVAAEVGKVKNTVLIEGHTDSLPYAHANAYTNWELSSDRANAARRVMQSTGIRPDQVTQVRGYADQLLRIPKDPANRSNRRITIVVQSMAPVAGEPEVAGKTAAKPAAPPAHH
ncbi:MAG: OmpA family protein [Bryobacteraceae bacterium]|nr:OmpA family protein [Bryobacteraceae bacterium]